MGAVRLGPLVAQPVLDAGEGEGQCLAEVAQDDVDARVAVEQPAENQPQGVGGGFDTEAPR